MAEMIARLRGTDLFEALRRYLPRGGLLEDAEWRRRHRLLLWILAAHLPALTIFGFAAGWSAALVLPVIAVLSAITVGGALITRRRPAMWLVTLGLTSCSVILVAFSHGTIEAHFHFFIIVGFLALYQDWFPFLWNIIFTVLSHGIGSALVPGLIFAHHGGHENPWVWSLIHGVSVLACCAGVLLFWHYTEAVQNQRAELARRLADAEIERKRFTSDLLLNLARRNQSMYQRQLDIINDLEASERDPDVLAELFRLDHLATRVRRNAESLLVLSGEQPARVWSAPVALRDVVRAAIAETEDLERIVFTVDEQLTVQGNSVADLTHLLAELVENAVRFSPPSDAVTVTSRPYHLAPGAYMLIVEDTGVGMPDADREAANSLLELPREVDVGASRQLGFHVVTRLASRHGIGVQLTPTPGCGLTAVVILPAGLFATRPSQGRRPPSPSLASAGSLGAMPRLGAVPASPLGLTPGHAPLNGHGRHAWPGPDGVGDHNGHQDHQDHDGPALTVPAARAHAAHAAPEPSVPDDDDRTGPSPAPAVTSPSAASDGIAPNGTATEGTAPDSTDGTTPRPRLAGRLIHPLVVPPPREPAGTTDPAPDVPVGAPTPREPADPPLSGDRLLRRRVPQTHLAPELAGTAGPHVTGSGTPSVTTAPAPASRQEALGALSRYQASRRSAQDEIDDSDPADSEPIRTGRTHE